ERHGRGRTSEIDLPGFDRLRDLRRNRVGVDLQPNLERETGADRALDDLLHLGRVGPELLIAERVEAEDALPCIIGTWRIGEAGSRPDSHAKKQQNGGNHRKRWATHRPPSFKPVHGGYSRGFLD